MSQRKIRKKTHKSEEEKRKKKKAMKLLTINFLSCPVKSCKINPLSFPLHFKDAELALDESQQFNESFMRGILGRIEWGALLVNAVELGFTNLPSEKPTTDEELSLDFLQSLHKLLLQTKIMSGKLVCGSCGHEFMINEGIANFLLPNHLV